MNRQTQYGACSGILFSLKKEDILTYIPTWMSLENTMLSEISQSHKDKYYIISLIRAGKFIETESRISNIRGRGKGERRNGKFIIQ